MIDRLRKSASNDEMWKERVYDDKMMDINEKMEQDSGNILHRFC
jgi:hypothetical protein